jgi:hypothetical protein
MNWDKEIEEIELFFSKKEIPLVIKINDYITIIDSKKFIESHLAICKGNNGNKTFIPYLNRLKILMNHVSN